MSEIENIYLEARKQWFEDARTPESESMKDKFGNEFILMDGYTVYLPRELHSLRDFKAYRFYEMS